MKYCGKNYSKLENILENIVDVYVIVYFLSIVTFL